MTTSVLPRLPPSPSWILVSVGSPSVAVAERDALGTTARIAIWPPHRLRPALGAVDAELARLDQAASRFRADSEICRVQARAGHGTQVVSESLAEVVQVALTAAAWTGGLVDPTIGAALVALGYDRDFELIATSQSDIPAGRAEVPGWQSVWIEGRLLRIRPGTKLDFGATAKGLGSDWAARAALGVAGRGGMAGRGGVLVSLGGDIVASGEAPRGGWPVLIADEHRQTTRSAPSAFRTQIVRLSGGAIATSSTACRQWRRAGATIHHIVDPRTGQPANGPWRTVSVAAATCAEANAAATAAIVSGDRAAQWLALQGMPARLVSRVGTVLHVAGWPAGDGGSVTVPPQRMLGGQTQGGQPMGGKS